MTNKVDESPTALRFNTGKVEYELIPTHLLENTARVFTFGKHKYSAWNWAKPGMKMSTIIGCIKRHLAAIERGEDVDPESGLPHTGHLGCNLLMLEHVMRLVQDPANAEQDDRPTKHFSYRKNGD